MSFGRSRPVCAMRAMSSAATRDSADDARSARHGADHRNRAGHAAIVGPRPASRSRAPAGSAAADERAGRQHGFRMFAPLPAAGAAAARAAESRRRHVILVRGRAELAGASSWLQIDYAEKRYAGFGASSSAASSSASARSDRSSPHGLAWGPGTMPAMSGSMPGRRARRLRPAFLGLDPLLGLLLRPVLPRALSVALAAGTSLEHASLRALARRIREPRRRSHAPAPRIAEPPADLISPGRPGAPEIVAGPATALR